VSRSPVSLQSGGVGVEVLDRAGRVVFPPAVPFLGAGPCCGNPRPPTTVRPRGFIRDTGYAILRGDRLRAFAVFADGTRTESSVLHVALTRVQRPVVSLQPRAALTLSATPTWPTHGPPTYSYSYRCLGSNGWIGIGAADWVETTSCTFRLEYDSECSKLLELHAVVAWLDRPVGRLDFVSPAGAVSSWLRPEARIHLAALLREAHLHGLAVTAVALNHRLV
jgi:hypothetical protein